MEDETIKVTTKDPKKVEASKRLAEYNRKKWEELKNPINNQPHKEDNKSINYGNGGVMVLGLVRGAAYYVYRKNTKKSLNQLARSREGVKRVPSALLARSIKRNRISLRWNKRVQKFTNFFLTLYKNW